MWYQGGGNKCDWNALITIANVLYIFFWFIRQEQNAIEVQSTVSYETSECATGEFDSFEL